jgi:hypothetical protein
VRLTSLLQLLQRLRMSGAVPFLPLYGFMEQSGTLPHLEYDTVRSSRKTGLILCGDIITDCSGNLLVEHENE